MKISIAISILILAVAALLSWNDHRRLLVISETHRSLAEEAASLGLAIDFNNPETGVLITKRAREDKDARARLVAKELIGFALEMEAFKENGDQPDEAMQERITEFMDRMLSLDAGQLKTLIAEFRASTEMEDETRTGMIMFAIMTLASDHPQAALTLFTESEDLFDNEMIGKHLLSSALANWASSDPDGALEWVRENGKKHPDLITDEVKAGLVKGAASNGIALGFDLLGELKLKDPGDAIRGLASAVDSPGERTEFLTLYREFLKTATKEDSDLSMNAMHSLGEGIVKDGFEQGSRWIAENDLSEDEIVKLVGSIGSYSKSSEKGQWIEWMGVNLPEQGRDSQIRSTMRSWTQTDYRAAGEWLAGAPAGPAKNVSVSAYAKTVAEYDPQTAEQWALTLPPGKLRDETLEAITGKKASE